MFAWTPKTPCLFLFSILQLVRAVAGLPRRV